MKRIVICIGLLFLLFINLSTSYGESARLVNYQVDSNYPPFTYAKSGYLYGFDPDLTNLVFNQKDYELEYSTAPWTEVYQKLKDREIDLAGIIAVTEERKKEMLFSDSLFISYVSVYTVRDFRKIELEDLKELRVGVGTGYYTESLAKNDLKIQHVVSYPNIMDALADLSAGKIDVIFENQQLMDNLLINGNLKGYIIPQITNLYPREHAYAISKSRPDLVEYVNGRIKVLKKNGAFEELYMKYFYAHSDGYLEGRNRLIIGGAALIYLIGAAVFYLMRAYAKKLKEKLGVNLQKLQETNDELTVMHEELMSQYIETQNQYDKIEELNAQLSELAYTNKVTHLPNRIKLNETIEDLISGSRSSSGFALFYLDLDNFKEINDTFGHVVGDQVLLALGERLNSLKSPSCSVYNMGGDEFIVMAAESIETENLKQLAGEILLCLSDPVRVEFNSFYVMASGGVVTYPEHGSSFTELLKNADVAMYQSKASGKGTFTFFDNAMGEAAIERTNMQNNLRKALENNEFQLYYQPQMNTKTGRISGYEALIRWKSPEKGFIMPNDFIKIAEESRLIIPIGDWVLETACNFLKSVHQDKCYSCIMSVNISGIQLLQDDFTEKALAVTEKTGISPHFIELEITESIFLNSPQIVAKKLESLRAAGFRIALDDFGTGYSSLSYLSQFPISTLKIDKSFINTILDSKTSRSLTGTIIRMGHTLGMELVAEGIEMDEQQSFLSKMKCDRLQGYYFCKPLNELDAVDFLTGHLEDYQKKNLNNNHL